MSTYTTLDKVPLSRSTVCVFLLKTRYFHVKPVKNGAFFKGCGRWQDHGHSSLWFELTGNTEDDVKKKAERVMKAGTVIVGKNLAIKKVKWWSDGGYYVDLNQKGNREGCTVPKEDQKIVEKKFSDIVPVPKGLIKHLLSSSGGERVDVRGVVTEIVRSANKAVKVDVWIKDDSGDEILAELWGKTFKDAVEANLSTGDVLQLDNVTIKVSGTGMRTLSGKHFADDDSAHSFMVISPNGPRSDELVNLGTERGNRISEPWKGSGFSPIENTGLMYPAQRALPQSPSLGRLASGSILNDSLGSPGKPLGSTGTSVVCRL